MAADPVVSSELYSRGFHMAEKDEVKISSSLIAETLHATGEVFEWAGIVGVPFAGAFGKALKLTPWKVCLAGLSWPTYATTVTNLRRRPSLHRVKSRLPKVLELKSLRPPRRRWQRRQ